MQCVLFQFTYSIQRVIWPKNYFRTYITCRFAANIAHTPTSSAIREANKNCNASATEPEPRCSGLFSGKKPVKRGGVEPSAHRCSDSVGSSSKPRPGSVHSCRCWVYLPFPLAPHRGEGPGVMGVFSSLKTLDSSHELATRHIPHAPSSAA